MSVEYNGLPFTYNAMTNNVNVDIQLAGILANFNDDYIMDVVRESIVNRIRVNSNPIPNIVAAYENTFKQLSDGFTANLNDIETTRRRVYSNIIGIICDYYNLTFTENKEIDLYSAAYWLYDFFISGFTDKIKMFYTMYIIRERYSIDTALGLSQRKDNSSINYSKKLFKDETLASIHFYLEEVISQMGEFSIDLNTILNYTYPNNPQVGMFISQLVSDNTGTFFRTHYNNVVTQSRFNVDLLTYIKLNLQQMGSMIEKEN